MVASHNRNARVKKEKLLNEEKTFSHPVNSKCDLNLKLFSFLHVYKKWCLQINKEHLYFLSIRARNDLLCFCPLVSYIWDFFFLLCVPASNPSKTIKLDFIWDFLLALQTLSSFNHDQCGFICVLGICFQLNLTFGSRSCIVLRHSLMSRRALCWIRDCKPLIPWGSGATPNQNS